MPDNQNLNEPTGADPLGATVRPDNFPKTGERWICKVTGRTARVMADDIEGYVVARFKGAMPWLIHRNNWASKYKRT